MKKLYYISFHKRNITNIISSFLLIVLIILINALYFSTSDSQIQMASFFISSDSSNTPSQTGNSGKLAIIIDDFGQNRSGVKEMMSIDSHLTFAVMPFLTFSKSDAENGHKKGYEIIVHLPMEAYGGKISWVGPRPILTVLNDTEVRQIVYDSLQEIPYAVGANIHMGSKAGDDQRIISDILDIIKEKDLYFVDSRASKHPIAKQIADSMGVPCYDRDIFLDGKKSKSFIKNQLKLAGDIALRKGKAVAIGHVGTEGGKVTAEAIAEMLPEFQNRNIQLVFVSELEDNIKN